MAAPEFTAMHLFWSLFLLCSMQYVSIDSIEIKAADSKYIERFEEFMKEHGRLYKSGTAEFKHRYNTFLNNMKQAEKFNALRVHNDSAIYGTTQFSDLTPEEFQARYLNSLKPPLTTFAAHSLKMTSGPGNDGKGIPPKWDWRTKGIITPVKNQNACGGCWAFSTVETVESMWHLSRGNATELSVQQVIDCAEGCSGCKGGDTCTALKWMKNSGAPVVTASQYPLTDSSELCKIDPPTATGVFLKDYTCDSYVGVEDLMMKMIYEVGPLAVTVDATSWSNYQGGVIQHHCLTMANHAVQVVGYDITGAIPHFIVRNSWGPKWGNDGYLKIRIGGNVCGIAHEVSSVTV